MCTLWKRFYVAQFGNHSLCEKLSPIKYAEKEEDQFWTMTLECMFKTDLWGSRVQSSGIPAKKIMQSFGSETGERFCSKN